MQIIFAITAALTLVSAIAAMSLKSLIHCALCLAVSFAGLAAIYLELDAPFAGWAQILVYIGAVAILIVFAILLTRSTEPNPRPLTFNAKFAGIGTAALVFAVLARAILGSAVAARRMPDKPPPSVRQIGEQLMTHYVLPLETAGLLLTAAAVGAVIIAMRDPAPKAKEMPKTGDGPAKQVEYAETEELQIH